MNEVLKNMAIRRSVRVFQPQQIQEEELQLILEAGRQAPSGGNNQRSHLLVIQKESLLCQLRDAAEKEFAPMEYDENTYKSLRVSIEASRRGGYEFYFKAPTLVVVANKIGYGNNLVDSACCLENMMLAATSLGIGTCYINQLHWLDEHAAIRELLEPYGLGKDETICGAVAIGYPGVENPFHERKPTGNPVTIIR